MSPNETDGGHQVAGHSLGSDAPSTRVRNLVFEAKDVQIFAIPDIPTRLDTLQNYFFRRLDVLLDYITRTIMHVYETDPLSRLTYFHHPNHRKSAQKNVDMTEVLVGFEGRRKVDRALKVRRRDGTPYRLYPTSLLCCVDREGISVHLQLFHNNVDAESVAAVSEELIAHLDEVTAVFSAAYCSPWGRSGPLGLLSAFGAKSLEAQSTVIRSPQYHLPASSGDALPMVVLAFVALFPVLELQISTCDGTPSRLRPMLSRFRQWLQTGGFHKLAADMLPQAMPRAPVEIPELPSYSMVRPGLWWRILARDQFRCYSCGRTSKDGIVLHVDHILPRSLGGTNDESNLQTLCWKCNIGKSNKSTLDLR